MKIDLISAEEWRGLYATMYLESIPGMLESIVQGMKEPLEEGVSIEDIEW